MTKPPFSIYIHIPYCFHKCPYCDFNTYAVAVAPEIKYTEALLSELDFRAETEDWIGREVQTIFFGGGTPSLFAPKYIKKIISLICNRFPVSPNIEITMEVNPGTVTIETLGGYKHAGVNRLSIGAQSFNPATLRTLGRMHSCSQIENALGAAKAAGFSNLSLDLIYGVDGQSIADLCADLSGVVSHQVDHCSPYCLTIEKGTEFYVQYKKGKLLVPPEEMLLKMMSEISSYLTKNGFNQYEISNFAKPGKEAKHNMAYWNGDDYLGLGAGAHSYKRSELGGRRWANKAIPKEYIQLATSVGVSEAWFEDLDLNARCFEYFFLGLRKIAGVSITQFTEVFGVSPQIAYPHTLDLMLEERLMKIDGDFLALTSKGLMVADSVIENFLSPNLPPT